MQITTTVSSSRMEMKRVYELLFLAILLNLAQSAQGLFLPGPWIYAAHSTFYGTDDATETMGGACGYGNLYQTGYGTSTTALSSVLFKNGVGCGGCYQIRCVNSKYCYPGSPSVTVTATNLCPANWAEPSNNGGWCNPPREHFDMAKPSFTRIAYWRAGIVPVAYRRVPCIKQGGIRFNLQGNYWWLLVYITNVGGPGDIRSVMVKGSHTGWIPMTRNWGAAFQVFRAFHGQSLSFMITAASSRETVIVWNVAPASWQQGATYQGGQLR